MLPTNSVKPIEFFWPSPDSFKDLTVEDTEEGFTLSAPDGTECAEWIAYWNQDEAHHAVFEKEFIEVLRDYSNKTLEKNGEDEILPHGGHNDSEQAQMHSSGSKP
jgi:hypothetical protein